MRLLAFLPLTYIAGVEGFGWFVPYLLLVGVLALVLRHGKKRRAPAGAYTPAPISVDASELEPAAA